MKHKKTLCTSFLLFSLLLGSNSKAFSVIAQEIQLSDSSINYGEVFVGDSLTKSISLINAGSDTLFIDSLITEESIFEAFISSNDTSFVLAGDSIQVSVKFLPDTANNFVDSLTISSNLPDIFIYLAGSGVLAPSINVSPEEFSLSVLERDSAKQSFNISNTGGANLIFEINSEKSDPEYIYGTFYAFDSNLDTYASYIIEYSLAEEKITDTLLVLEANTAAVESITRNGNKLYFNKPNKEKAISVFDLDSKSLIDEIGLNSNFDSQDRIIDLSHNGVDLYGTVFDQDEGILYLTKLDELTGSFVDTLIVTNLTDLQFYKFSINNKDGLVYTTVANSGIVKVFDLYSGELISELINNSEYKFTDISYSRSRNSIIAFSTFLGYSILEFGLDGNLIEEYKYEENAFDGEALVGLTADESFSSLIHFLSPLSDTLGSGLNKNIEFRVFTEGLKPGITNTEIVINSNDPETPQIEIPIELEVIGGPKISVDPDKFQFNLTQGDSINGSFEILNSGFTPLNYSVSALRKPKDSNVSFYTGQVNDNSNVIKYTIEDGNVTVEDTLYSRPFGAFGIRGISVYKDEVYFIDDKDDFEIISTDVNTSEITGRFSFEGFPEIYATAQYKDKLIAKKFDFETNQDNIVTVDLKNGTFPDTLASSEDFGERIQTITANSQTNELLAIVNSGIKILNLDTKVVSEFVGTGESLRFQHFSYSPFEDRLYVTGYDLSKPEGENLGLFVFDYLKRELVEFIQFHHEFSEFSFDETGAPAFIEVVSETRDTLQENEKREVGFKINTKNLDTGVYEAEFLIRSNDQDNKLINIPIELEVSGSPVIDLNLDTLKFVVIEGENLFGEIEIGNFGNSPLDFKVRTKVQFTNSLLPKSGILYGTSSFVEESSGQEFSSFLKFSRESGVVVDTVLKLPLAIDIVSSLAYHNNRLFFYDPNSINSVQVFDIEKEKVVDEIDLPFEFGYVYSLSHLGNSIFATIQEDGNNNVHVVRIDAFNKVVNDTLLSYDGLTEQPVIGVAANSREEILYLASNTSSIKVYDLNANIFLDDLVNIDGYLINSLSYDAISDRLLAFGLNSGASQDYKVFEIIPENTSELKVWETDSRFISSLATNESGFAEFVDFSNADRDTINAGAISKLGFSFSSESFLPGKYTFSIIFRSNDPNSPSIEKPVVVTVEKLVSNESKKDIPSKLELSQNYPNPFNPSTNISYGLPESGNVQIKIYNVLGQQVMTLVDDFKQAGRYNTTFEAGQLSSGVYFYRMTVDGQELEIKKMLLLK